MADIQLQVRVRGADGAEQTLPAVASDTGTLGTLRQKLAAQGLELLAAHRMPAAVAPAPAAAAGTAAAAPPPAEAPAAPAIVATPENTTASTTTTATSSPAAGGRSFASRVPQAGGAALGASLLPLAASAFLGPKLGPLASAALAALGAGIGGAGGEAAQAGAERADALPASAPGSVMQRATRGGVESGVTQAGVGGLGLVARGLTAPLRSVVSAIEDLRAAPVGTVVRAASGRMASLGKLLADPDTLAAFEAHPEARDTLARAWWEQVAPQGPAALRNAWSALGEDAQASLFGDKATAISALMAKMNPLAGRLQQGEAALALSRLVGVNVLGHGLPGTLAVGEFLRSSALPAVAANLSRSPLGAATLAGASRATQAAAPFASFLGRLAAQEGTSGIVPPTPRPRR